MIDYTRGIIQASPCRQLSLNKFVALHAIQPKSEKVSVQISVKYTRFTNFTLIVSLAILLLFFSPA